MARSKTIDTTKYFCPNPDCPNYGKTGPDNQIIGAGRYGKAKTQLLRCKVCGKTFSVRRGTALFGLKTPEEKFFLAIACLVEGNSIRATARICGCDKDTIVRWLKVASQHVEAVNQHLMVNLSFPAVQLDEFWSFVKKKEANLTDLERLSDEYGDCWGWVAFEPQHKVIVGLVFGAICQANADELVRQIKEKNDGSLKIFFSDQRPHYEEAILKHYGIEKTPPRTGKRGRPKKARLLLRPGFVYAQVVKQRSKGRVVSVTTKLVFGKQTDLDAYFAQSTVSCKVNTAFVERQNGTFRQHNRRFTRATLGFSKEQEWLEQQAVLFVGYYHFCLPHGGLQKPISPPQPTKGDGSMKKWKSVTPAMSIGVTDHVWTLEELLTFRIPLYEC